MVRTIGGEFYPKSDVADNASVAMLSCINQGAACRKTVAFDHINDYLIMLSCEAARQRGATPVQVQRNTNYFNGIN